MLDRVMLISTLFALTIALPLLRSEHALILERVYLNGIGPLRMAIDTGAQSTTVTPLAASRIGLKPQFRVEYATPTGTRLVPGGYTRVQTGSSEVSQVETIICDLEAVRRLTSIDGVIGQSWLERFNYMIDLRGAVLLLDVTPPAGKRYPFLLVDGRPAISIGIDRQPKTVVLDSGAPGLVLFGALPAGQTAFVRTNNGVSKAERTAVNADIPGLGSRRMDATVLPPVSLKGGLLPLNLFSQVYVNNRDRYVVLRPR